MTFRYSLCDDTSTAATAAVTTGGVLLQPWAARESIETKKLQLCAARGSMETKKNILQVIVLILSACPYSHGCGSGSIVTEAVAQCHNAFLSFW